MYQIEKPHSGYCLSLECKTQMFVYALLLSNNELETTPFVNNNYLGYLNKPKMAYIASDT